jgi:hypothetical protein
MGDALQQEAVGREVTLRSLIKRLLGAEIGALGLALAPEAGCLQVEAEGLMLC